MGLVTVTTFAGAQYTYECSVPHFDAQRGNYYTRLCNAWGGSFVVLPK
jgi:hypothetical protein